MRKYNQSINSGGLISPEVSLPSIKNHEPTVQKVGLIHPGSEHKNSHSSSQISLVNNNNQRSHQIKRKNRNQLNYNPSENLRSGSLNQPAGMILATSLNAGENYYPEQNRHSNLSIVQSGQYSSKNIIGQNNGVRNLHPRSVLDNYDSTEVRK